jgi:hypothetical protein
MAFMNMPYLPIIILLFFLSSTTSNYYYVNSQTVTYTLNKLTGSGCPYTASFIVHLNLLSRILYYEDKGDRTKMETANFKIIKYSKIRFQFDDPFAYYVNHMSAYEHVNRKLYGYNVSEEKTQVFSLAALHGECGRDASISLTNRVAAVIPFYGGRPPNVTSDLKVNSIGQGNSLVRHILIYYTCTIFPYVESTFSIFCDYLNRSKQR